MVGFKPNYDNNNNNSNQRPQIQKQKQVTFKEFPCKHCGRKFLNTQALGGHQNAHKKEREEMKHYKQEMSMMMADIGPPFIPANAAFIVPHGLVGQQNQQPFSWSSPNSYHQGYWHGSYSMDAGSSTTSYAPSPSISTNNNQVQMVNNVDVEQQQEQEQEQEQEQQQQRRFKLELPDLNLDLHL